MNLNFFNKKNNIIKEHFEDSCPTRTEDQWLSELSTKKDDYENELNSDFLIDQSGRMPNSREFLQGIKVKEIIQIHLFLEVIED